VRKTTLVMLTLALLFVAWTPRAAAQSGGVSYGPYGYYFQPNLPGVTYQPYANASAYNQRYFMPSVYQPNFYQIQPYQPNYYQIRPYQPNYYQVQPYQTWTPWVFAR
jgi:hypothetical protein